MALEQLLACVEGRPLESLGPTEPFGPDEFPLLVHSELRREHAAVGQLIVRGRHRQDIGKELANLGLDALDATESTRYFCAFLERLMAQEARLSRPDHTGFFHYGGAQDVLARWFARAELDVVLLPTLRWLAAHQQLYYAEPVIRAALDRLPAVPDAEVRKALIDVWAVLSEHAQVPHLAKQRERLESLLGEGAWLSLVPGEVWTDRALADLAELGPAEQAAWLALLGHCRAATSSKPSPKWTARSRQLLAGVGEATWKASVLRWFELVDRARSRPFPFGPSWESIDERQRIFTRNADVLRGLLWIAGTLPDPDLTRGITRIALSAYRKARGLGPRATKVGNAAVYALGQVPSADAVGQLAILKVRVKVATAQKGIEQALTLAAEARGVPKEELEEMSVPTYGLTEVGRGREELGEYTAELACDGRKVSLVFRHGQDGKPQASVPAALKEGWAEELKELKRAAADIETMLPVQAARLEQTYLQQRSWPLALWRERYLDHPLVGIAARRLIWQLAGGPSVIWHEGRLVGHDDRPLALDEDGATVRLFHPLDAEADTVRAWRAFLERHQRTQPFKQAHREIYVLTDAERATGTYSNRFAAHVIRQHQANALAVARGWKAPLRLMVDDEYPPIHLGLPHGGLRAEFWVEGLGDDYGVDTAESGAYLFLSTDQVRFYRTEAALNTAHAGGGGYSSFGRDEDRNHPLPLESVPPLVLSEVLRDVDLMVGVASVGNDPTWQDGGPGGHFREYWQEYSFGELGATAQLRREVLASLLPKLKIAARCELADRFLVVRGDLRTYRIHLGSGNILMEPGSQYLCIVPKQAVEPKGSSPVFLPFEGDRTLSVILSKALLLAADTRITDPTIVSQIRR